MLTHARQAVVGDQREHQTVAEDTETAKHAPRRRLEGSQKFENKVAVVVADLVSLVKPGHLNGLQYLLVGAIRFIVKFV